MKSSPRPPRRFSRWQTTKRTFVLSGVGPKPIQNLAAQDPRGPSTDPAPEKNAVAAQQNISSSDEMRNSFDSEGTISSRGSNKPRHVRRLKLNSSQQLRTSNSVLSPVKNKSAPANRQYQVLRSADRGKGIQDVAQKSSSPLASSPEKPVSTSTSSPKKPATTLTSSPERPATTSTSSTKRPASASSSSPEKPASASTSSTKRPAAASSSSPEKPVSASSSSPEKPASASTSSTKRPAAASSSSPEKPVSPSTSSTKRPAAASSSSPEKPASASTSSPEKPDTASTSTKWLAYASTSSPEKPPTSSTSTTKRPASTSTLSPEKPAFTSTSSTKRLAFTSSSTLERSASVSTSSPKKGANTSSKKPTPTSASSNNRLKGRQEQVKEITNPKSIEISSKDNDCVPQSDGNGNPSENQNRQDQTKSLTKKRTVSYAVKENVGKRKETKNVSNASTETVKPKKRSKRSDFENSKSLRSSQSRPALQEVSQVSSSNSIDSDMSFTKKGNLRDRSKLKSPDEMLKMRQYPEKYLASAKKSANSSLKKSGSTNESKITAPPHNATKEISVQKLKPASIKTRLALRKDSQESKSSSSPLIVGDSDNLIHGQPDHTSSEKSHEYSAVEVQKDKGRLSQKKAEYVETDKGGRLKRLRSQNSSVSIQQRSYQNGVGKSNSGKENRSKLSTPSRDISKTPVPTFNKSFGGHGLRNRSDMASPECVQNKRQYPISFYSSKTQRDILNASTSNKSNARQSKKSQSSSDLMEGNSLNKIDEGHTVKKTLTMQMDQTHGLKFSNMPMTKLSRESSGKNDKLTNKNQPPTSTETTRKQPSKVQAHPGNSQVQPLSLPRQRKRNSRKQGQQMPTPPDDNQELLQDGQSSMWQIEPVSANIANTVRPHGRVAGSQTRMDSAIDETVVVSQVRAPQKRKLLEQLSQEEPEENRLGRPANVSIPVGKRKVFLWCEEGHSRRATDVNAYDVIYQAALDVEEELSNLTQDRQSQKLAHKVFSGFKNNLKYLISQEIHLKDLEKEVKERQKRCKQLLKDVAEKQTEALSLKQDIASLETTKATDLQRISSWMKDFAQLAQVVQEDELT